MIATSFCAGAYMVKSKDSKNFFVFGHTEYDGDTLGAEYRRDVEKGLDIMVPANYYPDNDSDKTPLVSWRSHAQLLYTNWLNYYVYQTTPYDLDDIGRL